MQTFLPFWDHDQTGACLDRQRLGKQRVEGKQILNALLGYSNGWSNHPATKMWRGYIPALCNYVECICDAWRIRGYDDNVWEWVQLVKPKAEVVLPSWWGDQRILDSHRSNLLRKDPIYYRIFGWTVPDNLPYYWPV